MSHFTKRRFVRSIFFISAGALAIFLIWWSFDTFFKIPFLPFLKKNHDRLQEFVDQSYILSSFLFCLSYAIFTFLCLPASSLFMVTAGLLFGPYVAPIFIVISATAGGTLLLIAMRAGLHALHARLSGNNVIITGMIKEFDSHGILYLFILRLTGFIPVSLTNIAVSFTHISPTLFFLVSALGMIPIATSYALVGVSLADVAQQNNTVTFYLWLAGALFFASKLIAGLLLFLRYLMLRSRKSTEKGN